MKTANNRNFAVNIGCFQDVAIFAMDSGAQALLTETTAIGLASPVRIGPTHVESVSSFVRPAMAVCQNGSLCWV